MKTWMGCCISVDLNGQMQVYDVEVTIVAKTASSIHL